MDLSRQEYPALLASLQPGQATSVLNDRIRLINKINADIADWLQERRRVEEAYAQGLRKLATRQQLDNGAALGIFQIPWQRIVNATEMVASSHETYAQKIEEDVERPLRDYHSKNHELASMPGVQSDLATLAKNLEASHKKVEKAKEKGPKGADKLAGAIAAAEEVKQQWESRAPFVFEQLQAADESRLNHLRDALTQLETHESDQVERCRQAAETCLNVLLNVETADEIKTFAAKVNGGRPESPNEIARIPSETNDHGGHGIITSGPAVQSPPTTANGAPSSETPAEAGLTISDSNQPRVDSEGFSEPPQTIDEITRAQREAAGLDEPSINLTIRDQPIFEDEDQAKQAMDDMANQLRLRAQQTGVRRNLGTLRGRRDVRNTVFIPTPSQGSDAPALPSGSSDVSMPTSPGLSSKHAASPSTATDDHALSDTTSVRSGHTLHGTSGPVAHPDLHEPGLNASIVETVNAWFSEGVVTKSFVTGELALAYNGVPEVNTIIRLDNFQVLEKVAANPHFVNEERDKDLSDEKRGQYSIHLPSIVRPSPTVAFKYQLHVDSSEASAYCPVIFKPAWNIEEFQASVIVFYSLNPSFTSSVPRESITLKNLVLTVNLDTSPEEGREVAHATNAVMYPNTGASFRRKHSAVTWKIPEFEVKAGSDGKLLVRFSTTTSWPRKGKVDAKFEVRTSDAGSRLAISTASQAGESTPKGSDPFADEDTGAQDDTQPSLTWKEVPTTRKLVGSKYISS
ncbi:hypothetical protein BBP40_000023 [Aspergillus hancockii]|nr:hypothetical protein BBP40_000023 [Aspergillus hancockii]